MEEEIKNEHHDKMIKGFNMIFEETAFIKQKNIWANEHIDYINTNTRNMFVVINKMQEEINSLTSIIKDIKSDMEMLRKG